MVANVRDKAAIVGIGSTEFSKNSGRSGNRFSGGVSGDIITPDAMHWGYYMPFGLLTPASWVARLPAL